MMSKKPKIMHFAHWPVSGITSMIKSLLNRPSMQAFEHYILLCEGQAQHISYFGELISDGKILSSQCSLLSSMREVPKVLKQWQPDLIHSHSFQPSLWTAMWRSQQIPHLRTIHSPYPYFSSETYSAKLKRSFERWALSRKNTQVVAVSQKATKQVQEIYQLPVDTLSNGVDQEAINQAKKRQPTDTQAELLRAKRKGHKVLVSCGRLHPEKGYDLLLQAFYQLTKDYDNLMLWLIGDGQQRSELAMEIQRLGLTDQVFLLGHQENPYWYLAQSDIYVASSHYEGSPLAPMEALSLGLSVVAAPSTVEPLALNDEIAVCLPGLSIDLISSGIRQLLDNSTLEQKIRKASPQFAQRYSIDQTAESYVERYNTMLNKELS